MNNTREVAHRRTRYGSAIDHAAFVSAVLLVGLGVAQLTGPARAALLTGLPIDFVGAILAGIWCGIGMTFLLGIATRKRAMTRFAATIMIFAGLGGFVVAMIERPDIIYFLLHGGVTFVGFTTREIAGLTQKAELRRALSQQKMPVPPVYPDQHNGVHDA